MSLIMSMEKLAQAKVGEIVATNFRTSKVLTAHNIDFCCGGGITLADACQKQGQDLEEVIKELGVALAEKAENDWQALPLNQLIENIVETHHNYVRATIPVLTIYLNKLCRVHGQNHPELLEINALFANGAEALRVHMEKEELVLFPYVKAMVQAKNAGFPLSKPHFEHIDNPVQCMEAEHEAEGARFKKIAQLSNNYTAPADACQTFKVTYALLEEFEQDLHKHVHLENNILFPSAQQMFQLFDFQTATNNT